jgi:hypothetical protein
LKSYSVTDFPLEAVVQTRIWVKMLEINRIIQLATEAAAESEITWKEAEAGAIEPTKKILELLDLIIPPNSQSPPSLQSTEHSKRDLTEHSKHDLTDYIKVENRLSLQLLWLSPRTQRSMHSKFPWQWQTHRWRQHENHRA